MARVAGRDDTDPQRSTRASRGANSKDGGICTVGIVAGNNAGWGAVANIAVWSRRGCWQWRCVRWSMRAAERSESESESATAAGNGWRRCGVISQL
jgi:hypothetical protein